MFGHLVFKTAVAGWWWCQLHFPGHVGIESVVASAWSHDHNLLPRSRKWKLVVLLSALPQGCSAEGLLLLEGDTVVLLSSFGSMFGDLVCCVISWKTTVGWYPRHDYSPVLRDLMKVFCETGALPGVKLRREREGCREICWWSLLPRKRPAQDLSWWVHFGSDLPGLWCVLWRGPARTVILVVGLLWADKEQTSSFKAA